MFVYYDSSPQFLSRIDIEVSGIGVGQLQGFYQIALATVGFWLITLIVMQVEKKEEIIMKEIEEEIQQDTSRIKNASLASQLVASGYTT